MRMYELWKLPERGGEAARLEDAGGPCLFPRECDAEEYIWDEPDRWEVCFAIVPVQVGHA